VTVYAPPYAGSPTTTISTALSPGAVALDAAGDLFIASERADFSTVTVYGPPYTGTPTTISSGTGPGIGQALALDAVTGDLFIANNTPSPSTVTVYAPPYTGTPTTISTGVNGPPRSRWMLRATSSLQTTAQAP